MHIRRPPSGDGPKIYRPNELVAPCGSNRRRGPSRTNPNSIPPPPRDSLLAKVNRRRGTILTVMVSIAAIASFGSVVWWAHNQDVRAGGKGLEPLVVQAPTDADPGQARECRRPGPARPGQGGLQPHRARRRPGPAREAAARARPRPSCRPAACRLPAAPKEPEAAQDPDAAPGRRAGTRRRRRRHRPAANAPTVTQAPSHAAGHRERPQHRQPDRGHVGPDRRLARPARLGQERGRRQVDLGRLQAAHGDVLANLRMQPAKVDLGDKGVWYRVQAGPLDEKQAQASAARSRPARPTACWSRRRAAGDADRPLHHVRSLGGAGQTETLQ